MQKQKILMCPPDHFAVDYVINPWMQDNRGKTLHDLAVRHWTHLRDALAAHAEIALVVPQPKLPDMVFTANAGFVLGKRVVVSRFHADERRGEEAHFRAWFTQHGFDVVDWPDDVPFEGAGDALLDRAAVLIWAAHGFRTSQAAHALLEKFFARHVVSLRLVDPRFYHLDTCLCPLAGGYIMYYPSAFDDASRAAIEKNVPEDRRIPVVEEDALQFCCNAVDLAGCVFMNGASPALQDRLKAYGFSPVITPLPEFMKSGGAAKCLTLKLNEA